MERCGLALLFPSRCPHAVIVQETGFFALSGDECLLGLRKASYLGAGLFP